MLQEGRGLLHGHSGGAVEYPHGVAYGFSHSAVPEVMAETLEGGVFHGEGGHVAVRIRRGKRDCPRVGGMPLAHFRYEVDRVTGGDG